MKKKRKQVKITYTYLNLYDMFAVKITQIQNTIFLFLFYFQISTIINLERD